MRLVEIRKYHEKNPHPDSWKSCAKCKMCSVGLRKWARAYKKMSKEGKWNDNVVKELKEKGEAILWERNPIISRTARLTNKVKKYSMMEIEKCKDWQ